VTTSCAQAIAELQKRTDVPRVILLDLRLPDGSGLALAERFREMPELNGTRLVGVSASGLSKERLSALAVLDEYWTKPVSTRDLEAALREWLGTQDFNRDDIFDGLGFDEEAEAEG
jgi:CheY-like chemotaxis protein